MLKYYKNFPIFDKNRKIAFLVLPLKFSSSHVQQVSFQLWIILRFLIIEANLYFKYHINEKNDKTTRFCQYVQKDEYIEVFKMNY